MARQFVAIQQMRNLVRVFSGKNDFALTQRRGAAKPRPNLRLRERDGYVLTQRPRSSQRFAKIQKKEEYTPRLSLFGFLTAMRRQSKSTFSKSLRAFASFAGFALKNSRPPSPCGKGIKLATQKSTQNEVIFIVCTAKPTKVRKGILILPQNSSTPRECHAALERPQFCAARRRGASSSSRLICSCKAFITRPRSSLPLPFAFPRIFRPAWRVWRASAVES